MQLYDIDFSVDKVIVVKKGNIQKYNYFICVNPLNGIPLAYIELTNKHKLYKKSNEYIDKYITCHGGILKQKQSTREAKGGNHATKLGDTESIYKDGFGYKYSSNDKTDLLLKVYPQYFKKVIKYGRVHHEYIRKKNMKIYQMQLKKAIVLGEKKVYIKDFQSIKHYPIPKEGK